MPNIRPRTPPRVCGHTGCRRALAQNTRGRYCSAHRYEADRGGPAATSAAAPTEGLTVAGDQAEAFAVRPTQVRSLAELVAACQIDTLEWEVERWVCNKWEMGSKDDKGQTHVTPLYQIKAWLKRRTAVKAVRDEIATLLADAKKAVAPPPLILPAKARKSTRFMLEVNLPDLHIGKLAWSKETGYQDYDLPTAIRVFEQAVDTLLTRTTGFTYDHILFPIGNDFFNADNKAGLTTRGTPQDVDSRYQKSFVEGRRMVCRVIDKLRQVAPVHCPIVPGNHDELAAWHLGHVLEVCYAKAKDVTIDNAPTMRKYRDFGKVMIMFTHGDKGKAANYPLLMATERPEMFGRTTHREVHLGHLHTTRLQEWNGVRVRTFSALTATDAWHSGAGFVGNARAAEALVWEKTEGQVASATFTLLD